MSETQPSSATPAEPSSEMARSNEQGMSQSKLGIILGMGAYFYWGFFPLYFHQLNNAAPSDVLASRIAWSAFFTALLVIFLHRFYPHPERTNGGHPLSFARLSRESLIQLFISGMLLGCNWLLFLYAVHVHQVVASSLGYFLAPLVNIVLGVWLLKERLSRPAMFAVGLATLAVVNEIVILHSLPWISLGLAFSWGFYGFFRKRVKMDAIGGLWFETALMLPWVLLYAIWQNTHGHEILLQYDFRTQAFLIGSGLMTMIPLLAFAAATRRLNLATIGMLMYINPTMQFLTAVVLFGEPFPPARIITFILIWSGLFFYGWGSRKAHKA